MGSCPHRPRNRAVAQELVFYRGEELLQNSNGKKGFLDELEALDQNFFPWPWKRGEVSLFLSKDQSFCLAVATKASPIIGLVLGEINSDLSQFHLYKILSHPAHRQQGLGRALMRESMRHLYNLGVSEMYLEVQADNYPAIKLYQDFCLKIIHRKNRFYSDGSDALIMLGVVNLHLFD